MDPADNHHDKPSVAQPTTTGTSDSSKGAPAAQKNAQQANTPAQPSTSLTKSSPASKSTPTPPTKPVNGKTPAPTSTTAKKPQVS